MTPRSTAWLHLSFRTGAVADGLAAAAMLIPAVFGTPSPLNGYVPDVPYRYAMGLAGSLMLGWTVLLLWADRRPVERRGVLPLTNLVILGLLATSLFALRTGFLPPAAGWTIAALQVGLVALFTGSYLHSRKVHPLDPSIP